MIGPGSESRSLPGLFGWMIPSALPKGSGREGNAASLRPWRFFVRVSSLPEPAVFVCVLGRGRTKRRHGLKLTLLRTEGSSLVFGVTVWKLLPGDLLRGSGERFVKIWNILKKYLEFSFRDFKLFLLILRKDREGLAGIPSW